ncbi:RDD family protein, partial [[Kitasatospora] papulosa]
PQGVPSAAYLAAVVHERQVRDVRRVATAAGHGSPAPAPRAVPARRESVGERTVDDRPAEVRQGAPDRPSATAPGGDGAEVRAATGFAPPA